MVLVGGGTRVAGFRSFVANAIGIPPDDAAVDPDAAVALGAALRAASLDGDPALADVMVLDVLPAALARALAEARLAAEDGEELAASLTGRPGKRAGGRQKKGRAEEEGSD